MGLGYALTEEVLVHKGEVLNPDFLDYRLFTAADMPKIETVLIEPDDPEGPFGAKGVGEMGATPVAAAIANASAHVFMDYLKEQNVHELENATKLSEQKIKESKQQLKAVARGYVSPLWLLWQAGEIPLYCFPIPKYCFLDSVQ